MDKTKHLKETSSKCDSAVCLYQFMSQFGWKNEKKLFCKTFPTTGRGLCSKTNLVAGDVLIRIPLEAMITLATLENDQKFQDLFEEVDTTKISISFQSLLAFYILFQRHTKNSPFNQYIASIPTEFSTPYFCTSKELHFLPEIVLLQTVDQNKKIRESFKALQEAFGDMSCPCCGLSFVKEVLKLDDYKWAYFAVNSRSVFVNNHEIQPLLKNSPWCNRMLNDRPEMALAPFLDLFNHSDTASSESLIEKKNKKSFFQLVTNKSYEPAEQIFISYGNLSNLKLFTEYGFSIENNVHDYFDITLSDIEALIKTTERKDFFVHNNKFKFIRDHNLTDQMFVHVNDGMSHNLLVVLYLIFKEPSYYPNVLQQTAFGASVNFEEAIEDKAKALCLYKMKEYQGYEKELKDLGGLSFSGEAVLLFLKHSITCMQEYLEKFHST